MKPAAVFAILFLFSFAGDDMAKDQTQAQRSDQRVLTADDFKDGRLVAGGPLEEESFWLRVNEKLPPYKIRLIPDATMKDKPGSDNPLHRVGRIEISSGKPGALVQNIEVRTHASVSVFREFFRAADVNLDGFLDIAVVDEFGAKWIRQEFWIFDRGAGRYISNSLTKELHGITHNGIEPHLKSKELVVSQFPQATPRPGRVSETYRIVNGHLVLIGLEEIRATSGGLKLFVRKRLNGKMRTLETRNVPST
jgi:hypothetical protein